MKNKDIKKHRPITPYFAHPNSKLLKIVHAALSFMMTKLRSSDRTFFSFDIGKPSNLTPLVARINKDALSCVTKGRPRANIDLFMGDIKQMYTELSHDELKTAVDWIILRFSTRYGRTMSLKVRKHLRKDPTEKQMNVVLGSSCVSNKRYYKISMLQLRALIHFDIDNVWTGAGIGAGGADYQGGSCPP